MYFLHSHSVNFPENCGDVSDEQGERFHQGIKVIEERYQGRMDKRMMADYCWSLKRDKLYQHLSIIRENQGKEVFFWNNLHVFY